MKVLGCFKIVPDLDLVVEEDWTEKEQLKIDTGYVKLVWNCFDESALEMMLRLSDLSEGFDVVYELSALTVGKQKHESFLKTLYALGFKHGIRICNEEELLFDSEQIAEGIANYVKTRETQDVIVTGIQSSDGSNRKTPYLIAEKLGWPCITQVIGMETVDEMTLKVTCQIPGGELTQTVKTPCVLAVGNASCAYLRIPTLKDKMKLGKQPIEQISPESLGMKTVREHAKIVALHSVERKRNTIVISGETPKEKAESLYKEYLKGRIEE
mgnify:CR=1 FL=1